MTSGSDRSKEVPAGVPTAAEMRALVEEPGGIEVVVQPIIALASGHVVAFEALARFPGLPSWPIPSVFSHAADLGLGPELEAGAIRRALEPLGRPMGTRLSVNVSPSVLATEEIAEAFPDRLEDIVVEVTEHELVADDPAVASGLRQLRERGARIAIDDMGVGYSGLQQLVNVEPDLVKLDRELTLGIHEDRVRISLVEAIVRFAHDIGTEVCAEGVEDLEDLAALADLDVDWGQGFAIARPSAPWPRISAVAADVCRGALLRALRASAGSNNDLVAGARESGLEQATTRLASARSAIALDGALDAIATELEADNVTLSRWVPADQTVETLAESGPSPAGETRFAIADYPLTSQVLKSQEAAHVLIADPATDPGEAELLLELGHRSMLMVPVVACGGSVGLMEAYRDDDRPWTRAQINHARIIANQFASVIEAHFSAYRVQ